MSSKGILLFTSLATWFFSFVLVAADEVGVAGDVEMFCHYFDTCTVILLLFCTLSNKCTIISQIITLLHVSTLSCHPQGVCNQYHAKLHKYSKCTGPARQ